MARRATKSKKSKKGASSAKKAVKVRAPKKTAKKKPVSKKTAKKKSAPKSKAKPSKRAAPKKSASKKAAPKKAAARKKVAPKKKTAPKTHAKSAKKVVKPAKKAGKKSAKAVRPAANAKQSKARPPVKRTMRPIVPPPKPRAKSKPSPAELEALRIAKELRKAQEQQSAQYDKAIRAFNSRRFQSALTLFEKVAEGPDSTFGDRARVHIEICRRQTQSRKVKFKTADEYYNYGIRLINERRLDEASRSIAQALKMQPKGAHIHFAAAVLGALSQDIERTAKSLKKAIDLDPRNRVLALNDSDLASVADDPAIAQLLHGDR